MPMDRRRFITSATASAVAGLLPPTFWAGVLDAQPNDGKTLVVALPTNPITIDPINQLSHDAMLLGQTVFENLVEYDIDGNLRPQLAIAMPDVSEDQMAYTFDLRTDVVFHNGKPLTGDDVKYSFEYLLDPDHKATRRGLFARLKNVDVLDTHRVRINMNEPYSPWMYFLSKYMGIFPAGSREKNGPDHFRLAPKGVGTGVGRFEEWVPDTSITFSRNPKYWRAKMPAWERLEVRLVPDTSSRMAFLQSGEIDIASTVPPQDFTRLKDLKGVAGEIRPTTAGWMTLLMDNTKAPFDDANFRLALSYAIDRKLIAEQIFQGFLDPCSVPAPRLGWWFDAETDATLGYDPARAADYLAKSKYATGTTFDMNVATDPYMMDMRDAALAVQAMLGAIGVTANIMPMEFNVLTSKMVGGQHQSTLMLLASPGEPTYMLQGAFTKNQAIAGGVKYQSDDIAKLLNKAFATTDKNVQLPIYHDIQKAIAESMPAITLGYASASALWRDRVQDFKVSQGITMNVAAVKI